MPVKSLPPFDLGAVAEADLKAANVKLADDVIELARELAGWVVTFRADVTMSAMAEISSGDPARMLTAIASIVVSWNYLDENGNELPKPTRANIATLGISDDVLILTIAAFRLAIAAPKATA